MDKKEFEDIQTRRDFFKNAVKATLPILGTIVLSSTPMKANSKNDEPMDCRGACSYGCQNSCSGTCSGGCKGGCGGACSYSCQNTCKGSCQGRCSYGCSSMSSY